MSFGGSDYEKRLLPAYQYLRLLEVSGLPPAIPGVSFSTEEYASVARWLAGTDPVRTQSAVFRRLDKKLVEEYLTRSRVAALEKAPLQEWIATTVRVIGETATGIGGTYAPATLIERRSRDRLQLALEILARLAVRATEPECDVLWGLLEQLHSSQVVRILFLEDGLRLLAQSLVRATRVGKLAAKFASLLDLPMAGESTFPVLNPHNWPDPVFAVGERLSRSGVLVPVSESIRAGIRRAAAALRGAELPLRRAGLLRMCVLRHLNLLAPDEAHDACSAFWETIQGDPSGAVAVYGTDALRISLLFLSPSDNERMARVKAHILDWKPGAVVGGIVNPDEMLLLIVDTATPRTRTRSGEARFQWTATELVAIYNKLREWWKSFGSHAVAKPAHGGFGAFDTQVLDRFISSLLDVLRVLILTPVRKSKQFGRDLVQFIDDLARAGVPVGAVMPATLLVRASGDRAVVASTIRTELASRDPVQQLSAYRGLYAWHSLAHDRSRSKRQDLEIPPDLIREVGAHIAARRPDGLRWALQCAREFLISPGPSTDSQFLSSLFVALDYLAAELRYGGDVQTGGDFPSADVPLLRLEVAQIAKLLTDQGHANEPSVARWVEAGQNDPLPEVRDAVSPDGDTP